MAVLHVLHYPDERLRTIAKPVEKVDAEIQKIVDDMFETMYLEEGIGLAATQVNIHQRIIVIDVSETRDQRLVLINPELLDADGDTGKPLDYNCQPFELEADDLLAICIQHEMDHLVGKLFVDYLSPLKRQRIRQKVEKLDKLDKKRAKIGQ